MRLAMNGFIGIALAALCLSAPVRADDFLTDAVTITNIYAVGGGTDLVARAMAQKIS